MRIEDEIKILKIENRIVYFTYGDKELMFHMDALYSSIESFVNDIIDRCKTIQWNEVFKALVSGVYGMLDIPYKIICCPHGHLVSFEDDGEKIYYCKDCKHIYVPLEIAVNRRYRVVSSEIITIEGVYYVPTYLLIKELDGDKIIITGEQ